MVGTVIDAHKLMILEAVNGAESDRERCRVGVKTGTDPRRPAR